MPLPNTLTGKWRCVCLPEGHQWEWDAKKCKKNNRVEDGADAQGACPHCWALSALGKVRPLGVYQKSQIVRVRDEQSGSFDDREGQEFG